MIVYFRLLAGLTSFMSFFRFVHFSASGPEGIRESRVGIRVTSQADQADDDAGRDE